MSTKATNTKAAKAQEGVQEAAQEAAQAAANVQEGVQEGVQEDKAENGETSEAENGSTANVEVITGIITKVMTPEGNNERISFVLDREFDTIDFNTGEIKKTNIFGMNIYAVVNQVGQFVSYIQLADALSMGKMINPQIIALSMLNAQVAIKRENHEAGEQRKMSTDVYARNCKTTDFVTVKPNIKPIFEQMLMKLITTAPTTVKDDKKNNTPNPFGM